MTKVSFVRLDRCGRVDPGRMLDPGFLKAVFSTVRGPLALLCVLLLVRGNATVYAQAPPQAPAPTAAAPTGAEPKIPNDQLDSLVAPIALYPDPLLAQMLAASTYPLEIIQLQQWMPKHKDLKGDALVSAVQKEKWDPSVQALAPLPDALKQLADNITWTTELGNAFLAQQGDVMDAIQRMRGKAQSAGNLKSSEQQTVETKVVENKTVVVIEPSNPQVVYVPSYNPTVVYGAPPVYPYPPMYYPIATAAISFGVGMMVGAAMSGGWGWGCGWGGGGNNTININNSNNFVNNANRNNVNGGNRNSVNGGNRNNVGSGNNSWQHNPQHRGGAPYSNNSTANKFGGTTDRQASARQTSGQSGAGANRGSASAGQQPAGGNRSAASSRQQPAATNRGSGGGGSNNIGNRSVSSGSSSRGGAMGGGSGGYNGSSARASSSRGSSSMSRGGGGGGRRR